MENVNVSQKDFGRPGGRENAGIFADFRPGFGQARKPIRSRENIALRIAGRSSYRAGPPQGEVVVFGNDP